MTFETMEDKQRRGTGFPEPIVLELPSSSEYALLARLVVSCAGQLANFEPEDVYDLKLAVTEAVTNVIRHAAVDYFQVEYKILPGAVEITVVDSGGGFDVDSLSEKPGDHGGLGFSPPTGCAFFVRQYTCGRNRRRPSTPSGEDLATAGKRG
jgi:anti-sigma regulatory factor (Ser/Thr protein kinase)